MGVEITGDDKIIREIERRLSGQAAREVQDRALIAGAKAFERELRSQMEPWKDTGATVKEITVTEPYTRSGERTISIHWKGPRNRYRIIHLNEFGTVNNPSPRGKGAIARALRNSEKVYRAIVKRELEAMTRG